MPHNHHHNHYHNHHQFTTSSSSSNYANSEAHTEDHLLDTFLYYIEKRHEKPTKQTEDGVLDWRMREKLKTVTVALVLCLNIGIDPPDVVKTSPCAKLECWIDPFTQPPAKSLAAIGSALQSQYEGIYSFH